MNINNGKENLSTEQSPTRQETWISDADGDEKRSRTDCTSSGEGSQTLNPAALLEIIETPDFSLPKANRLRKPAEFQRVYKTGKRFDGRFISAFILPNDLPNHRLGITASRKGVGKAVFRNRAKRLLREAFRLSKIELNGMTKRYDFVLNARRGLLKVKMQEPLADFQRLIRQIQTFEKQSQQNAAPENLTTESQ